MRRPTFVKQRRRLDTKVEFQRRTNERDKLNAPTKTGWAKLFDTRCAVYPAPGYERFANAQNTATAPILIEVRSEQRTQGLTSEDRAVINGVTYNIISPAEQAERGSNIRIAAAVEK